MNFAARSTAFMARGHALTAASVKERRIVSTVKLVLLVLDIFSLVMIWPTITVKLLVLTQGAIILLSVIANRVIYYAWVKPTLARIDREFPKP